MAPTKPDLRALAKFEAEFDKRHEDTEVIEFEKGKGRPREIFSTGSLALDYALGVGGFVGGRIVETWGPEQTGKSTLLTIAAGLAQKQHPDKLVAWIDVEATFDKEWAEAHGLDTSRNRLKVYQPGNAEDCADIVKDCAKSDLFCYIVLDSVGAMISQTEIDKDADEATMALVAKVVTRMVKLAAIEVGRRGIVLAIINQVRANLAYGADITRTGGFALTHVSSHRLKHRRTSTKPFMIGSKADGTEQQVGQEIAILVEKNKLAPPKRVAVIRMFNQATEKYGPIGIDRAFDAFTTGKTAQVFGRKGSWYIMPDGSEHNGEDATMAYLRKTPEAITAIREKVIATRAHEVIMNPLEEG
jgi:recombination protein RecA